MDGRGDRDDTRKVHVDGSHDDSPVEPSSKRVSGWGAVLAAGGLLAAGLWGGWLIGEGGSRRIDPEPLILPDPAPAATSPIVETADAQPTTTLIPARLSSTTLEILPDFTALDGLIAAAPFPGPRGGSPVWILSKERSVRHFDVPLYPGDYPYPLVMAEGHVAFADLSHVYLMDVTLDAPPVEVSDGSFLVPGGSPNLIWVIGNAVGWIAPLDASTAAVGERIDVKGIVGWPLAGVGEGLMVRPVDEATYGGVAYWTPELGLQSVQLPHPQATVISARGDLVLFASPDGQVDLLDVTTRHSIAQFPVAFGEAHIVGGCLSPHRSQSVIAASDGQRVVIDLQDGTIIHAIGSAFGYQSVSWASPDQLVAVTDSGDPSTLQAIDLPDGYVHNVAYLQGPGSWWMTPNGSTCSRY